MTPLLPFIFPRWSVALVSGASFFCSASLFGHKENTRCDKQASVLKSFLARVFFQLANESVQIGKPCQNKREAQYKKRIGTLFHALLIPLEKGGHACFPALGTRL